MLRDLYTADDFVGSNIIYLMYLELSLIRRFLSCLLKANSFYSKKSFSTNGFLLFVTRRVRFRGQKTLLILLKTVYFQDGAQAAQAYIAKLAKCRPL